MSTHDWTFPATKFRVPATPPTVVRRPHVAAALDIASEAPLTLVVADPAAGKTTAVAEWARNRRGAVAWLSCDADDNDSGRLCASLLAAIEHACPEMVQRIGAARSAATDASDLIEIVIGELRQTTRPLTVILDQVDRCERAAAFLWECLDVLPHEARVVAIARRPPQFPLARLRAGDLVRYVTDEVLRLTPDETVEVLASAGHDVADDVAARVHEWADGWLGGVVLLMRAWTDASVPAGAVETPLAVDELLRDELYALADDDRRLLVDLSVLETFDDADVRGVLNRDLLTGQHLPFVRWGADGRRHLHPLWRHVLVRHRDPDGIKAVQARALEWFADGNDPARVIEHAQGLDHWPGPTCTLVETLRQLYRTGGQRTLAAAIGDLDEARIRADPAGGGPLALGVAHVTLGNVAQGLRWLDIAERSIVPAADDEYVLVLGRAAAAVQCGDPDSALMFYRQLREQHAELDVAAHTIAIRAALWVNDHATVRDALIGAQSARSMTSRDLDIAMASASEAAVVYGALTEAEELAKSCLDAANRDGWADHPELAEAARALGMVCYERGDLDDAERLLAQSLRLAAPNRPSSAALSRLAIARLALARGDPAAANAHIYAARAELRPRRDSPLDELATTLECRVALAEGDSVRAAHLADSLVSSVHRDRIRTRVFLAQADLPAVREALLRAVEGAVTPRTMLDVLLLAVRADLLEGHVADARTTMVDTLELARPGRWVRPFLEDGPELVEFAAAPGSAHDDLVSRLHQAARPISTVGPVEAQT